MIPVAPRIVNDVSYVTWINHEIHFAWQAQIGAVFGELGVSPFVASAAFREILIAGARNDVVFFNTKSSPRSDE